MKKVISLLVVLALCLCLMPAALADAEAATVPAEDGRYITLESVGLKFWLPNEMKPYSLPQDVVQQSTYLGYYVNHDRAAALGITLVLFESVQITVDEVKQALQADGIENAKEMTINDLSCLSYSFETDGSVCKVVTVLAGSGSVVEFAFVSVSDSIMRSVVDSICAAE